MDGTGTEKAGEEEMFAVLVGQARRFMLQVRKDES